MPIHKLTEAEEALIDPSDYRFQVKFIFGEQRAFVLDLRMKKGKFLPLSEPATEDNYKYHFACICKVLRRLGECGAGEKVLGTTFPAGTEWLTPQGHA